MKSVLFVLFLFSFSLAGILNLANISTYTGQYHIITSPVIIQKGDTLSVPPGSVVLFSPYASLTVSGCLISQGSKQAPITFSSALDSNGNASAFDWVGIEVLPGGLCSLSYSFIGFSVSGLTAQDSLCVKLSNCMFSKNGQWSFKLADRIIDLPEMQPFSYPKPPSPPLQIVTPPVTKPFKLSEHKRTLCIISTAVCAVIGTASLIASRSAADEYYAFKPGNSDFDSMNPSDRQARFNELQSAYSGRKWFGVSMLAVSGIGVGFTLFFH